MNNAKHTPGPWHVEWAMAQGGEAHHVCDSRDMAELSVVSTVHFHDDTEGETKANTLLISAAPELLAALIALKTANGANNFNGWHEAFLPAIKMANDAIAKATGSEA